MTLPLWQGDKRWGGLDYGRGPKTIALWGCGLVCITEDMRLDGIDVTPNEVQRVALEKDPLSFVEPNGGASIGNFERIAAANGRHCSERVDIARGEEAIRQAIVDALTVGHRCMMHVDKTADGIGDHHVLATALQGNGVMYRDPATAKNQALSLATLRGGALWAGQPKIYKVVGVRVLFAALPLCAS